MTANKSVTATFTAITTNIDVFIGTGKQESYNIPDHETRRQSYSNVNQGPVKIVNTEGKDIVASQRVIYGGGSYSEMMGLPFEQLTKEYLFPYYNNVAMDSQLRVSNVGGANTTITIYLGTTQIDQYTLAAGGATRKNYTGRNSGPLRVTSSASNILATIRVLYNKSSYSELMGLPVNQLAKEYLFPYYNNVAMDSQLRVSNVGGANTTITVYLGTTQIDSYALAAGGATRKSYTGRNSGPLRVTSSASNILTTIRVLYSGNSYSELMGFPASLLSQSYWYPVYDNVAVDSQLRVSNVGSDTTHITVYAGTQQIDSYDLAKGAATRKNYAKNSGPLQVVSSTQPILTTSRLLYGASYYEMTGLPESQLSTQYFFPWYNNTAMSSELRIARP
jgi:N6-adenosine-specific RNA methylase IME4